MKETQAETSKSRVWRWLLIALAVLAAIAISTYVLLLLPPVRREIKTRFDDYLIGRLGQGAVVQEVTLGLNSVNLTGIALPLDANGSVLRIAHAELAIVPSGLLRNPGQIERILRSVHVSGTEVLIYPTSSTSSRPDRLSWLPKISIPPAVYTLASHFDSLRQIEFDSVRILLAQRGRAPLILGELKGTIDRRGADLFQLTATGRYLSDTNRVLAVTGQCRPRQRSTELEIVADVQPGQLPGCETILPFVTTGGGRVSARFSATDTVATLLGSAAFEDLHATTAAGDLRAASLHAALAGDSITLEPIAVVTPFGHGSARGKILLRGRGPLNFAGEFRIDSVSKLGETARAAKGEGAIDISLDLRGNLESPSADARLAGTNLSIFGKAVEDFRAQATITPERITIEPCSFSTHEGSAQINGEISLAKRTCDVRGRFDFAAVPSLFGWKSAVSEVRFNVAGPLTSPGMSASVAASDGRNLGDASLHHTGATWVLDISSADGMASRIELQPKQDAVEVTGSDLQHVATLLFPELQGVVAPLEKLDVRFAGDRASGTLEWDAAIMPDTVGLLPQIAREIHFSGQYDHVPQHIAMTGKWSGVAGDGYPFEGRADLTLADGVLSVNRLFIDAAGELKGQVDITNQKLDLELAVTDLDLDRLPLRQATEGQMKVQGTISGVVKASGSFDKPVWSMDLSMINGSVFGVPGYWLNLVASGQALAMTVQNFELGRDVRKIIAASGDLDFGRGQIAMTAEVGSARAEDFLLALLGKSGILSGELTGHGSIRGRLSKPDVEGELTVHSGLLLNALTADDFTMSFHTDENSSGKRMLRVPRIAFSKTNTYQFAMSADFVPEADGELHAHVEGSGNFLDLIHQLESGFRPQSSDCALRVDFGGTLGHPQFLGGELSLKNGIFTYKDATPGPVSANLKFELAPDGAVQFGKIDLHTGEQELAIETIPDCDSAVAGFEPLIIPQPRVCLGVIKIQTGENGFPLHLPGLMKTDWTGTLIFGSTAGQAVTISGYGEKRLLIAGNVELEDSRVTYPFAGSGRPSNAPKGGRPVERWLLQRLEEAQWNLDAAVGSGDRYDVELTSLKDSRLLGPLGGTAVLGTLADYFDHLTIDASLDPGNAPLEIRGSLSDATFHLNGRASSLRGKVDYLDQSFNIDQVYADFDETNVMPVLEGRASTMGVDTTGRNVPVYLTLYQIDRETNTRQARGRLNEMTVVLESDANQTPEQVLQLLGYNSGGDVRGRAEQLVASTFARAIGRQWLNPLTRRLERWTLLDEITISPGGGRSSSLARQQRVRALQDTLQPTSALRFFTGSQLTVGKYLTRDMFVTYTGELSEGAPQLRDRMGFVHSWNLEYRMNPLSRDLVLDFAVEYDEVERRRDESVSLKYFFALEP